MNLPNVPTVVYRKPWCYRILQVFFPDYDFDEGHIVTIGGTIYTNHHLTPDVIEHETEHCHQQHWSSLYAYVCYIPRFIASRQFRFDREMEAFKKQYALFRNYQRDPNVLAKYRQMIVRNMTAPLYRLSTTPQEIEKML